MGEILPSAITDALSLALYAMFVAIIVPQTKENRTIALSVVTAAAMSFIFEKTPALMTISSGMKVIIITVAVASLAAIFFPVKENTIEENYNE